MLRLLLALGGLRGSAGCLLTVHQPVAGTRAWQRRVVRRLGRREPGGRPLPVHTGAPPCTSSLPLLSPFPRSPVCISLPSHSLVHLCSTLLPFIISGLKLYLCLFQYLPFPFLHSSLPPPEVRSPSGGTSLHSPCPAKCVRESTYTHLLCGIVTAPLLCLDMPVLATVLELSSFQCSPMLHRLVARSHGLPAQPRCTVGRAIQVCAREIRTMAKPPHISQNLSLLCDA